MGVIGTRHLEFTSADRTTHAATYDVTVTTNQLQPVQTAYRKQVQPRVECILVRRFWTVYAADDKQVSPGQLRLVSVV